MNAARIRSFLKRNATLVNQSGSLGETEAATRYRPSPPSTELWSSTLPHLSWKTRLRTTRDHNLSTSRLFQQAVLLFAACIAVAFHSLLYRHCCSRSSSRPRNLVSFFH